MFLKIPFDKKSDRETAKGLGAKWRDDLKLWALADSVQLPESMASYRVQEILPSAELIVATRVDRGCETLKALAEDARLGIKLSAATKETLGKFDGSKGAPDEAGCKRLARELAVRVLMAGGFNVSEIKALTGLELLGR